MTELRTIKDNPTDYKLCKKCREINYVGNDSCIDLRCRSKLFVKSRKSVLKKVEQDIKFYDGEGYEGNLIEIETL